ncbi:MAG TPA: phosphoadenosine phosphosulfate reductase family protein [Xanthobacteraceae bacterium]|nr:phosphoadenosine phosphosulfate reductase family protein [Xanthobacteraceae bacterium]
MTSPDMRRFDAWATTQAFRRKVETAKRELDRTASLRCVVAVSFGKDSAALAHLAHSERGPIEMMHMRVAHALPGGERVEAFMQTLGTLHVLDPLNSLEGSIAWLRQVGLPHERTKQAHQKIIKERKRDRGDEWAQARGFQCTILGMRAEESRTRRILFRSRGLTYERGNGLMMSNPIGRWSAQDVWAYHVAHSIPWHPLYDCETLGFTRERLRSGGWLYTDGAAEGWTSWLRRHFPEQYRHLVAAFPRMAE